MKIKIFLMCLLCSSICFSAAKPERILERDSLLFIEVDPEIDGFIQAEIIKKKVAVKITLEKAQAQYVLTGTLLQSERKWHEGWLTGLHDHNTASVTLIDLKTNQMIWASEAGDRSMLFGAYKRSGPRKTAERIVSNLMKIIKKKEKK